METVAAYASPFVLVSDSPWAITGYNETTNFDQVFGPGNYTATSYASADASSIFTAANTFVMLEGGGQTAQTFANYLNTNSAVISSWVNLGGHLLIQSASQIPGWPGVSTSPVTFGPGTISGPVVFSELVTTGNLTPAGIAAFSYYTPLSGYQTGGPLATDFITGSGLTLFMTDDATSKAIIAGTHYGAGYVMYSGLNISAPAFQYLDNGRLTDNLIKYTSAVPEPSTDLLMFFGGLGILYIGYIKRRKFTIAL